VALTGWIDDRRNLSPKVRLLAQSVAVVWALYCLGGMPELILTKNITVKLGIWGTILAFIGGVWLINLYNFMDGIDGLAGGQGVFVSLAGAWFFLQNGQATIATSLALLALSLAGFLCWNWPPAKVFMGDVGSGFLGIVFFVYALEGEHTGSAPALVWAVLLAPFVIDATLTLLRRMKRKEKLFQAHRSHVYQLAVQKGHSHQVVTLSFLAMDAVLFILLVVTRPIETYPIISLIISLLILSVLWGTLDTRWENALGEAEMKKADLR
jgi:Fuc2NAc and GlcNAc transferase